LYTENHAIAAWFRDADSSEKDKPYQEDRKMREQKNAANSLAIWFLFLHREPIPVGGNKINPAERYRSVNSECAVQGIWCMYKNISKGKLAMDMRSTKENLSFLAINATLNNGRNIFNAFAATILQPFHNDCGNAVEIEHHNIVLPISWVVKSI